MRSLLLALVLLQPAAPPIHYHVETIASLQTSRHTHVQVTGRVTLVRKEADGDVHVRLTDAEGLIVVCEIIPAMPRPTPKLGQLVVVQGIRRVDTEAGHGWVEIHPVAQIREAVR